MATVQPVRCAFCRKWQPATRRGMGTWELELVDREREGRLDDGELHEDGVCSCADTADAGERMLGREPTPDDVAEQVDREQPGSRPRSTRLRQQSRMHKHTCGCPEGTPGRIIRTACQDMQHVTCSRCSSYFVWEPTRSERAAMAEGR